MLDVEILDSPLNNSLSTLKKKPILLPSMES
jgi:hypothetical protein